jgi:hypothetical protein
MTAFELRRNYCARDDWKKVAVTIDNSASAALLWQRTTWKSRSGRSKCTRCSSPDSRLGAATDAEIAVAPNPASTAARTASLDGSSSATRNAPADTSDGHNQRMPLSVVAPPGFEPVVQRPAEPDERCIPGVLEHHHWTKAAATVLPENPATKSQRIG